LVFSADKIKKALDLKSSGSFVYLVREMVNAELEMLKS